ncbi:unnamed protein product [Bursaphelenchus okinawaensis]|uniref:Uncharacterized protein n=1 Tax=Bursaphelenchus okinawaensis TaxID=465554 RepID=A0A811K4V0_9BILA|nr:unnamed protein product [Bursaphelenchus okinawaensis]CAG9091374.1 unnamed protein product [Bursaphelenchus okinawaensis]
MESERKRKHVQAFCHSVDVSPANKAVKLQSAAQVKTKFKKGDMKMSLARIKATNEGIALNDKLLSFSDLKPHCVEMLIKYMNEKSIVRMALVNKKHFHTVRYCFRSKPCINFCPNKCLQCLSREPCFDATRGCGHKTINKIDNWMSLLRLGILTPSTIHISSPIRPRNVRVSMHGVKKIIKNLKSPIYRIFLDVSKESSYQKPLQDILERNKDTIELIHIKNSTKDKTKLYFRQFADYYRFGDDLWLCQTYRQRDPEPLKEQNPADNSVKA